MKLFDFKKLVAVSVCVLGLSTFGQGEKTFEITPLIGHTSGGSFENALNGNSLRLDSSESFGIILGMKEEYLPGTTYEILYLHQSTSVKGDGISFTGHSKVDMDYLHFGGTYGKEEGILQPFVSGGLGLTWMNARDGGSEVRPSLSIGLGVKVPVTDHVSFRLEGRGMGTFFNSRSAILCGGGGCSVYVEGGMFWQFTAMAGVAISF